ncbi:hypothetical protein RUM8411_01815 [Ruegeria meonggei]|uniref:Uncharacterized protein n=1 Tax=Ruegeria meonggei TaxID=1446476 RepID=A0A1X6Z510_9RHOB|nr:hypothetical protein RUM8411_01815 [Ruegeria meonggei]
MPKIDELRGQELLYAVVCARRGIRNFGLIPDSGAVAERAPAPPITDHADGPFLPLIKNRHRCSAARQRRHSLQAQSRKVNEVGYAGQSGLVQLRLLLTQKAGARLARFVLRRSRLHRTGHSPVLTSPGSKLNCRDPHDAVDVNPRSCGKASALPYSFRISMTSCPASGDIRRESRIYPRFCRNY